MGIVQREVYSRLAARGIVVTMPRGHGSHYRRVVNWLAQPVGPPLSAALVCTTPAPLRLHVPAVLFVYDLRWQRTRGSTVRLYRHFDLRRAAARADSIFAISARTRDDILTLLPEAAKKCSVLHLGPGIIMPGAFSNGEPGTVLLAGYRSYKRNELMAEALAKARPSWARRFVCVGVSDRAHQTLVEAFGASACNRVEKIDNDEMRAIFQRTAVYVSASLEEGFGLPMVEALAAGCQVIAIRQPLTVEVLGGAGVLIEDGNAEDVAQQLESPSWVEEEIRAAQAAKYSWDRAADAVAAELLRVAR